MGGSVSHEYHYVSPVGEDTLLQCSSCGYAGNSEVLEGKTVSPASCPSCKSLHLKEVRGVEVAHTFLLGDKYSKPLGATFLNTSGKPQPLVMGCYGIGVTRIIAASLEVLSTEQELHWPRLLAPYDVCLIGPKQGSKEQPAAELIENELLHNVGELCSHQELLHDDRKELTIGKRLLEAKRLGHPLTIVVGAKAVHQDSPKLEVHLSKGEKLELDLSEALKLVSKHSQYKNSLLNGSFHRDEEESRSQSVGHQL